MKNRRHSSLQTEILFELQNRPALTITELAERISALRPSVSRSLSNLREQSLVVKRKDGWHLTNAGQRQAGNSTLSLLDGVNKASNIIKESNALLATITIDKLPKDLMVNSILSSQTAQMIDSIVKNQLALNNKLFDNFPAINVLKDIKFDFASKVVSDFTSVIDPLFRVQELNSRLISNLIEANRFSEIEEMMRLNNLQLSNSIENAFSFRHVNPLSETILETLFPLVTKLNQSFEELFRHNVQKIDLQMSPIALSDMLANITIPTTTVNYYNNSVRHLIESESTEIIEFSTKSPYEEFGDENLDTLLVAFDPEFIKMRQGSWLALSTKNPDYLRHAATSQRELIIQVLKKLIPSSLLPEDRQRGPQIKARAKAVLMSDTDADFVDRCSAFALSYYEELNKYTHDNESHEEGLRAILHAGEGLIRFILVKANQNKKS